MQTDNVINKKPSKDNVILGLARRDNPYSFNAIGNIPFEKGYIVGFNKSEEMNKSKLNNYNNLLSTLKKISEFHPDALPDEVIEIVKEAITELIEQSLIDAVLEEIKNDVLTGDFTAIEEMLTYLPENILRGYLPEKTTLQHDDTKATI